MARIHLAVALTCFVFIAGLSILNVLQSGKSQSGLTAFLSSYHGGDHGGQLHNKAGVESESLPPYGGDYYHKHLDELAESESEGDYLLGTGKADITGPVVEINMMGYADPKQLGTGVRQRLYSRAFIFGSRTDSNERAVYLVLDTQSGDTAIRYGILQGLADMGPEFDMYGAQNVAVTGTHSHSGPGAWLNYLLPQITSKGFDKQSYQAIVTGAVLSIKRAHESLQPGHLEASSEDVLDANISRSPYAYLANPAEERSRYEHDVDKTMTLLNFVRASDGKSMGILNWFAVHGTAMLGNNTLITGDNKGVAARLLEQAEENKGNADFVAGFSQANVGDTSPNILGAYCEDGTGSPCSFERSLCSNNRSEACHGRGPFFGLDDGGTKSCFEIGRRQFEGASKLMSKTNAKRLQGPIRSLHTYRDFSDFTFTLGNGSLASTCSAALGYSFAAGTTDGPGAFDFKQNSRNADANPLWKVVSAALHAPSKEQKACQAPKPILLDVGAANTPYKWTPNIVDIQLLRVGQVIIIVSPGEATTMSGRRWREAVAAGGASLTAGVNDPPIVVLGGPANSYTHYIATEEEYGVQRYEGASTLYGPHTLAAYINVTTSLLEHLSSSAPVKQTLDPGPQPPIQINSSYSFIQGVVFDRPGFFKSFGDVVKDVNPPTKHVYRAGDRVSATFIAANPRNNLRLEGTFARVERMSSNTIVDDQGEEQDDELKQREYAEADWEPCLSDADWPLSFHWRRINKITATSEADITWDIEESTPAGTYRFVYFGDSKQIGGKIEAFTGRSGIFEIG